MLALSDEHRESEASRVGVLIDLKQCDLNEVPMLAIGDGALELWQTVATHWLINQTDQ